MTNGRRLPSRSHNSIESRLREFLSSEDDIKDALALIPGDAQAVILYGSASRREMTKYSDIDLIVVTDAYGHSRSRGRVNASYYDHAKLLGANKTIFGSHLKRDAAFILGGGSDLSSAVSSFLEPDPTVGKDKVRKIAQVLNSEPQQQGRYLEGLVRLARYLLRTALYLDALAEGQPCFSVRELATRSHDPGLVALLSSHPVEQEPDSLDLLNNLLARIVSVVGVVDRNPYGSIPTLVVAEWEADPELSSSALRSLRRSTTDPYVEIPRIII